MLEGEGARSEHASLNLDLLDEGIDMIESSNPLIL
jgi:hypothetical protein